MNWEDDKEIIMLVVAIVLMFACIFGGGAIFDKVSCAAKTEDIGFSHRWSVLGGCQIEVKENQWIPLDSYYFKQQ